VYKADVLLYNKYRIQIKVGGGTVIPLDDSNLRRLWDTQLETLLMKVRTDSSYELHMTEHVHQYYELILNFSSVHLRHTVAGRAYETDTPFILFRAPYILHSTIALDAQEYTRTGIVFHPCTLKECGGLCQLGRLANCWECLIPTTVEKLTELQPLLVRLHRVWDPAVPKYVWLSALAILLWEISEMAESAIIHDTEAPPYVQDLLWYVVEHAEEDLTIDSLAEKFYISRAKLTRDFRAAVHMSLHEYVTAIRIHRAKILLSEDMPLSMIAQQCGFSADASFAYMFRRHTGMTPGEYRRQAYAEKL